MKAALEALTLAGLAVAAGVVVAVWLGFIGGIAINVAKWFL
jgi:hypothetical protein